jgi:hypothetical protein
VDVPPGFSDAGLQLKAETWGSVASVREAEAAPPFSEAVICAEPSVVNVPAVAVKLAVVAPALAVTDSGTETLELLVLSAIATAEAGAGLVKVTIQEDGPPGFNAAGVQLKVETRESAVRVSEADAVPPLSEAVICAEPSAMNDPAVAVKLAVAAPTLAVTDAGTETIALLEFNAIAAPEAGAGLVKVTIQEDVPPGFNDAGLQLKPAVVTTDCTRVIVPPLPDTAIAVPVASETTTFATWIAVDVLSVPGATAKVS